MYKVIDKLNLPNNRHCISIEGDIGLLDIGREFFDEKGNIFIIELIGMTHYTNFEDSKKYADVVLCGDIEKLHTGTILTINEGNCHGM